MDLETLIDQGYLNDGADLPLEIDTGEYSQALSALQQNTGATAQAIEAAVPSVDLEIKVYRRDPRRALGAIQKEHLDVFYKGQRVYTWLVSAGCNCMKHPSSGAPYFATTPPGNYKIFLMHRHHRSTVFNNARMDFAMFFRGGIALHATYGANVANLGKPASGGCVRQDEPNAEALFNLVTRVGVTKTRVLVSNVQDKSVMYDLTAPTNPGVVVP